MDWQRDEKHEKVAIVSATDAIVDPRTVVVKDLNTVVTDWTVGASGWPVELAGDAPFHAYRDPIDFHISVERRSKVIFAVFVCIGSGYDSGVHKGGQTKVHQYENGQDSLVQWNDPEVHLL